MTTTENSRAEALTDEQFEDWLLPLLHQHLDSKALHYCTREQMKDGIEITRATTYVMNLARALLAAPPASQPASRAEALTEIAQFLTDVVTAAGLLSHGRTDKKLATRISEQADELRKHMHLLAAPPASQPAAAPIHADDAAVDRFAAEMKAKLAVARAKGRGGWEQCAPAELSAMLREHVDKGDPRDVANFCAFLWNLGASITAPAPADERAAFLTWWCADVPENMREGWVDGVDECLRHGQANDRLAGAWEGFQYGVMFARASSASETGAEADHAQCCDTPSFCSSVRRCTAKDAAPAQTAEPVAWQYRVVYLDYTGPWIHTTKEGMETLRDTPNGHCEVRDLYAAPQPPAQADAPAETRDLPMMRNAFRVTEVSGDPDTAKQSFAMRFSFPSLEALHAADDEWNKFIAAAPADAREGLTDEQRDQVREATIEACAQLVERIAKKKHDRGADDALVRSIAARIRALLQGANHAE